VFTQIGGCKILHTNNEHVFGVEVKRVLTKFNVSHNRNFAYTPRNAGLAERCVQMVKRQLAKLQGEDQATWDKHLPMVVYMYNATVHAATRFSPYFLMYGREPYMISAG
jgi:hypothetical protein